jgi:diguanylate cyclase (GGDEF)-like protein
MLSLARRHPRLLLWPILALGVAGLLVDAIFTAGAGDTDPNSTLRTWLYDGVLLIAALTCLARAAISTRDRIIWFCFGAGLAAWAAGDVYWGEALAELRPRDVPYPSLADAGYLLAYPFFYFGVLLLVRRNVRFSVSTWLDGGIAALASAALVTAVLAPALVGLTQGDFATVATNLAYPLADVVLLSFLIGGVAVAGLRGGRSWLLIGSGIFTWGVADSLYLHQVATGGYHPGFQDSLYLLGALLIAAAAATATIAHGKRVDAHSIVFPVAFAAIAVGVLAWDHVERLSDASIWFAVATLAGVVIRMVISFRENRALLLAVGSKAVTDALTGLGNRRAVVEDLEFATAPEAQPSVFAIFDLDGFKAYNDRFGHPAGDKLLHRLGQRLAAAVAPEGTAYRLGGDEFCVLVPGGPAQVPRVLAAAASALSEQGDGFTIGASSGASVLPAQAANPAEALRMADMRMYAEKGTRSSSARSQTHDVLVGILREGDPSLSDHLHDVARLAVAVGRELGFEAEDLDVLGRAAELHDVGKVAIPDRILHKPGPLDPAEWDLMRSHTTIGQRILAAAPAMGPVAELVRSSHERWDGEGYPDGLAGEQIPLGSRVIFVCDAFEAMTTERSYRRAVTDEEALRELRAAAGSQFDPHVVEIFADTVYPAMLARDLAAPVDGGSAERFAAPAVASSERLRRPRARSAAATPRAADRDG